MIIPLYVTPLCVRCINEAFSILFVFTTLSWAIYYHLWPKGLQITTRPGSGGGSGVASLISFLWKEYYVVDLLTVIARCLTCPDMCSVATPCPVTTVMPLGCRVRLE